MNRNTIANTSRRLSGACVCLRASAARMSRGAAQVNFGEASPDPGAGAASP